MSVLWIIYLIIGAILGFFFIYMALHEKNSIDFENDINAISKNEHLGTILLFILILLFALLIAFVWPVILIIAFIKRGEKNDKH